MTCQNINPLTDPLIYLLKEGSGRRRLSLRTDSYFLLRWLSLYLCPWKEGQFLTSHFLSGALIKAIFFPDLSAPCIILWEMHMGPLKWPAFLTIPLFFQWQKRYKVPEKGPHNSISLLWSKSAFPWKGLFSIHYYYSPGSDSISLLPPLGLSDHLPCYLYV